MNQIAILIPVCSRNQGYTNFEDTSLFSKTIPFLSKTMESKYKYNVFVGIDDDDIFFLSIQKDIIDSFSNIGINVKIIILNNCQHAPATAWSVLAKTAYESNEICYDYFFQIGDDVEILSKEWTTEFIKTLNNNSNVGVTGPISLINYNERKSKNIQLIIENAFVHRTHLDIFEHFFDFRIKNWFCDNWITGIYNDLAYINTQMICTNNIRDNRYSIHQLDISPLVANGKQKVKDYIQNHHIIKNVVPNTNTNQLNGKKVFSYCLYGNKNKYYDGLIKNLDYIRDFYPGFETHVHLGSDVSVDFINKLKTYKNVSTILHTVTGPILKIFRLFSVDYDDVSVTFLRNTQEKFSLRCKWVIKDFLTSSQKIFTIRDHKNHSSYIIPGLTGFKNIKPHFKEIFEHDWKTTSNECECEKFIVYSIYYRFLENIIVYTDNINYKNENTKAIPLIRVNTDDFCGIEYYTNPREKLDKI